MHPVENMLEVIKRLRAGESVTCTRCKSGVLAPMGNCRTASCFACSKCGRKININ